MIQIAVEALQQFAKDAFIRVGLPREEAEAASHVLLDANLDGIDSHGISRLPIYIRRLREGRINPKPQLSIHQKGNVLVVDGDNGLGQVVTVRAMEAGFQLARSEGVVTIAIRHSNHFGQAGYYCKQAAEEGLFSLLTTNTPVGIPPWGGRKPYFGTNPIAFGFPTQGIPIVIDMSSSVVARGKIILAAKNKESIPLGWAIDQEGKETTDPDEALKGAVLPMGGAKGYALALAMEVLAGILTGAAFGPHITSIYEESSKESDIGHFILLSNVSHYLPYTHYLERVTQLVEEIKAVPRREGVDQIYIPGERRHLTSLQRKKEGIPLTDEVYAELNEMARQLGIRAL